MTIRRDLRTSARQMDTSHFWAVLKTETLEVSEKLMPTRFAIGETASATRPQLTRPNRVGFGQPSVMFSRTSICSTR